LAVLVANDEDEALCGLLELEPDVSEVEAEFSAEIRLSKVLLELETDGVEKRLGGWDVSEFPNKTLASCICIA
jgi:hypothetical protein